MCQKIVLLFILMSFVSPASADVETLINTLESRPYEIPGTLSEGENHEIYRRYCTRFSAGVDTPQPKWNNPLVSKVARILNQTQVDADKRLAELRAENWKDSLPHVQGLLETLMASTNSEVAQGASRIANSLSEDQVGFSENQNQWFQEMLTALYADIKVATLGLNPVVSEFSGVNFETLTTMLTQLKDRVDQEARDPDFNHLKTLAQSFKPFFASYSDKTNAQSIIDAFKFLQTEFATLSSTDEELSWIVDDIKWSLEYLEGDTIETGNAYYTIQSILRFLTGEEHSHIEFSPEARALVPVLVEQALAVTAQSNSDNVDEFIENIDLYLAGTVGFYEVRYRAGEITDVAKLFISFINDASLIANAQAFISETETFGSIKLKKNLAEAYEMLTDGDSSNDKGAAQRVMGLDYMVNDVAGLLSEQTQSLYQDLLGEATKIQQDEIKTNLQNTLAEMQAADASNFMEHNSWNLHSLSNELDNQVSHLSPAAQQKVSAFASLSNQWSSLENVSFYLNEDSDDSAWHFYFYGGVRSMYRLSRSDDIAKKFLVQLCGEFRDRATMIEAKLKWITRLYTINDLNDTQQIDYSANIWSQMAAKDYHPFLEVTHALWLARKDAGVGVLQIGQNESVDAPVTGPTVCETKYIFDKYIKQGLSFDSLEQYNSDFENIYKAKCTIAADLVDYYDFRGDSNFKHYSPESNAMIWKATGMARACRDKNTSRGNTHVTDQDCEDYYTRPFYYRYNAARAALATGMFYHAYQHESFDSLGELPVTINTHLYPHLAPFGYETETSGMEVSYVFAPEWLQLKAWNRADIGFNAFTGLGTDNPDYEKAYERIRGSVDRHTNWYSAGYKDGIGDPRGEAFSPFVASSYVMSASDHFTQCGTTVQCPPDGLKRWMFIFRVKPENWYNPARLLNNEPVDFDRMWFDETSFGDSGLADAESAWDRMGTPMEEELDSILYLINVNGGHDGYMDYEGE